MHEVVCTVHSGDTPIYDLCNEDMLEFYKRVILADFMAKVALKAHEKNILWSVENPRRSLLWCQHTSAPVPAAPQGLKEQTIAEVLEADPEMRKEIEEEMKNHQWGV